jgi:predicted protein tyrosine phosphatase
MEFQLSWVLKQELALGRAPQRQPHLELLENAGVQGVLSLCAREEAPPPPQLEERFRCRRLVLPDSHYGRAPEPAELQAAVAALQALLGDGPVYLHCQAGLERSPLVAMAWLMQERRLDLQAALEYLREVHPASRPQAQQLAALRAWHAAALAA